ncbi:uncharacterized protein LOC143057030 [Mytilus galloprovincialis]|uniref:uncharacterized protein LOC143057030 n=1 Tax=Mytilus galloprovincialis TaxID=29158 RepID=UPI003F7CC062
MTIEMCADLCTSYRYFGLEASEECFCDNSMENPGWYIKTIIDDCQLSCRGNLSQKCGGYWRISVYIYIQYLGCYTDDESRMLDQHTWNLLMTLQMCIDLCSGFEYIGLQYLYHCLCGNSLGDSDAYYKVAEINCQFRCGGDTSQICGGIWKNSVYKIPPRPTTESMTSVESSIVTTTELTTPGRSTIKTTELTTLGRSTMITTELTTPRRSTMKTTELATPRTSTAKNTELTTPGRSTTKTTELTTPGRSTMKTTELTTPRTSTVKTTEFETIKTSTVTTEPTVKTISSYTILKQSEITTVQPSSSRKCFCPCSKVGKGKWDFVRGMNRTLDELREILKADLDLMKKELTVNKSNTTRMRRSKISAPDDRVSAASVGYVGVVFICLITVFICFLDMLGCLVNKFKKRS